MFRFHTDRAKADSQVLRASCQFEITLLSSNEKVRFRVKQALSVAGGSLHNDLSCLADLPQTCSLTDIYVIDPDTLVNPACDAAHLLDDKFICVVLFGGPAGLVATRPAVRRVVDVDMGPEVLATILLNVKADLDQPDHSPKLSLRERETLRFYGRGMTLKEIGYNLGISAKSAETYKTRACQKLGLSGRAEILEFTEPSLNHL